MMVTIYKSFVHFILFKSIKETPVQNQNKKQNLSELEKLTTVENRIEYNDGTPIQWSNKLRQKVNKPGVKARGLVCAYSYKISESNKKKKLFKEI